MTEALHLDDESVEAIARRVVELLQGSAPADELLDAAEVARRLSCSRDWVYSHASELGAVSLGDGERPRLRFPAGAVRDSLARSGSTPERSRVPKSKSRRRRRPAKRQERELLPIGQAR